MIYSEILQIQYEPSSLRVNSREIASREFKENFEGKEVADYLRTMAAMANGDGGTIIFGITDSPRTIVGINADFIDEAKLSNLIKEYFDPYIQFEIIDAMIEEKKIHILKIPSCRQKPIICKKVKTVKRKKGNRDIDETVLEESAIYYRYSAQTSKIRFADLQNILKERQRSELSSILQNFEIMDKIGFQNVGIIDANSSHNEQKISALYVSEETAKNLNLIQKGKLVEDKSSGSAAYYIVGEVELKKSIHVHIPDSDRILPTEAREELCSAFKDAFPNIFTGKKQLTHNQLKKIACNYGIRDYENNGKHDTKYCYYDSKTRRFFYRKAFIKFIKDAIRNKHTEILSFIQNA